MGMFLYSYYVGRFAWYLYLKMKCTRKYSRNMYDRVEMGRRLFETLLWFVHFHEFVHPCPCLLIRAGYTSSLSFFTIYVNYITIIITSKTSGRARHDEYEYDREHFRSNNNITPHSLSLTYAKTHCLHNRCVARMPNFNLCKYWWFRLCAIQQLYHSSTSSMTQTEKKIIAIKALQQLMQHISIWWASREIRLRTINFC